MKKPYFVLAKICLFFSLVGCTPSLQIIPQIIADKLVVKVGETISVTVTGPTKYVSGESSNPTFKDFGFIYSQPAIPIMASDGDIKGPYPSSEDNKFLVDSDVEVVSPSDFDVTLPPRIPATREGDMTKVTFGIKGKSVGTVILRAAFISELLGQTYIACGCGRRVPLVPTFDGTITIQVVP
jgi:hypothetical protein